MASRHCGQTSDSFSRKRNRVKLNTQTTVELIRPLERGKWFRGRKKEGVCWTGWVICEKIKKLIFKKRWRSENHAVIRVAGWDLKILYNWWKANSHSRNPSPSSSLSPTANPTDIHRRYSKTVKSKKPDDASSPVSTTLNFSWFISKISGFSFVKEKFS